jgi:diguanylate cyclase (GGDEF)-like protein
MGKVVLSAEFFEAGIMHSRGDSSLRVVSEAQAHAMAAAALDYRNDADRAGRTGRLVNRIAAIIGADVVLLSRAHGTWSVVVAAPLNHPFTTPGALGLFDGLAAGIAAVHHVDGESWTLLSSVRYPDVAGLAIGGDWSLSPAPFFHLAGIVGQPPDEPAANEPRAPARAARLHYRMMQRLARVSGLTAVGDTILRHAAGAVAARLGALAVTRAGDLEEASIVSTFGYPRALVEHVRIEPGAGVIGTVMQSRKPVHAVHEGRPAGSRRPRYRTGSYVAVPILGAREVLGAICVTDRRGDRPFERQDVASLRLFAAGAALALERERALDSAEAYAHAATVDPVTGVFNRRYFQVRLDEELQRSRRHQIPLALLMIDVDDFKVVNDSHGHLAGDTILRDVGDILRRSVRVFDVCARFGGEEFVIIMPGSTSENALRIAERIRERIEAYRPSDRLLAGTRVTVSVGLAVSSSDATVIQLLERADQALYAAKRAGKNCIRGDANGADAARPPMPNGLEG